MIRTALQLESALAMGRTVSLQALFDGRGFRLATDDTNETVSRSALARCVNAGKAAVLQADLAGAPCRWGAA